ncbi:MAG TPA: efflux RND transporter permease subunit, partial [Patescibacteria group bacterium]|nr:efflux RND transporter permease subunit [Patescibacteria group bacterium]
YANRKVREGMDKKEAIAIASGIRFRPIILTKVTALAGLLPLAVFSPFWRGLSLVVIFGILSSGVLSLFTTPVLYSWLTRTKKLEVVEAEDDMDNIQNPPQDELPFEVQSEAQNTAPTNLPV